MMGEIPRKCPSVLQLTNNIQISLFFFRDKSDIVGLEKVISKYCEYMSARGQKKRAILVQLSMLIKDRTESKNRNESNGNAYVAVLDSLLSAKMIGLAGRFLYICQTQLKVSKLNQKMFSEYNRNILFHKRNYLALTRRDHLC